MPTLRLMNACKHSLMLTGNVYDFQGKCRLFLLPPHPILLGRVRGENPRGILLGLVVLISTILFHTLFYRRNFISSFLQKYEMRLLVSRATYRAEQDASTFTVLNTGNHKEKGTDP